MLQSIESKIYNICNEVFCNINDRRVIHQLLQTKIYQLAQDFNYKAWREFRIPNVRDDGRDGLIDVVWFKVMKPFIAFEIDSSFRSKSIKKLLAISAPYKFWIYYGHENRESLTPKEINLIYAHRYKRKSCRKCLEKSNGQIAKHFGVTTRRVQQIIRFYWKTGAIIIMVLPCRHCPQRRADEVSGCHGADRRGGAGAGIRVRSRRWKLRSRGKAERLFSSACRI